MLRHQARNWLRFLLEATVLAVALPLASPASGTTLTRGPYLQLMTTHSVTIAWNTDTPALCSLTVHPVAGAATVIPATTDTVCAIPVTGLSPGTQYGYTPNADGVPLRSESIFRTDDPTQAFTFIAIGDSGSGDANQLAVRDRMAAIPADFILHTGDMVYDAGAAADLDPKLFTPYQDLMRTRTLWPCRGNHDVRTDNGAPWRAAFYTPANNPAGTEDYYSFDFGNAHFVMLDSNQSTSPGSPQYKFLDEDLGASVAFWKLVAFHHPMYSSGFHGSTLDIQANLVPLFDKYSVDLVLNGHDHDYERTKPLRGGQVVPAGAGTVYIVTGGGGQPLRPLGMSSFTAYAEAAYHVTRVTVNGKTLEADMVRVDGQVRDAVTLAKDAPSPTCVADADCDDGTPCTVDSCHPDGCHHETVNPGTVKASIEVGLALDACGGQTGPPFLVGLLHRAASTVDRAAAAPSPGQADQLMTVAVRRLAVLARRAAVAAKRGRVSLDCTAALGPVLSTAESRGECLASRRPPVADTYIEAQGASKNHGGAPDLDVDGSPQRITYLKFDLSAIPGRVHKAMLDLRSIKSSVDAGAVYSIPDSSWSEGSGNDKDPSTAHGAGLTWKQVDTNGDKTLDTSDGSSFVPQKSAPVARVGRVASGQVVHLNVTRALQGGAGLYTLAIMTSSSDGTAFASREHPTARWRPALRIVR